jgi:hypothetical protein
MRVHVIVESDDVFRFSNSIKFSNAVRTARG